MIFNSLLSSSLVVKFTSVFWKRGHKAREGRWFAQGHTASGDGIQIQGDLPSKPGCSFSWKRYCSPKKGIVWQLEATITYNIAEEYVCLKQRLRNSFLFFFCTFQLVIVLKELDFLVFFENRNCNFCQPLLFLHMKTNISHILSPEMSQAEDLFHE